MQAKPVRTNNAIDHISFILNFEEEFEDETVIKLHSLKDHFGELTEFDTLNVVQMMVANNAPRLPLTKPGGVVLKKPSPDLEETDGKPEWSITVANVTIQVDCMLYTRWHEVFPKAMSYLVETLKFIDLEKSKVSEFAIQVEDAFVLDDPENYSVDDVFNSTSSYLTSNIQEHLLWHVHQGWFVDVNEFRVLNNLNLSTHCEDDKPHLTKISHLTRVAVPDEFDVSESDGIAAFIEKSALLCHDINKQVIGDLLNQDAKAEIGL